MNTQGQCIVFFDPPSNLVVPSFRVQERGANIHAEFLGGSFTCDAYHMTEPHPEGR